MKRHQYTPSSAFTLIELVVVVGILGILVSISVYTYQKALIDARIANVYMSKHSITQSYISYHALHDVYPTRNKHTAPPRGSGFGHFCEEYSPCYEFMYSFIEQTGEMVFRDPFQEGHDMTFVLATRVHDRFKFPQNPQPHTYLMSSTGPNQKLDDAFFFTLVPYSPTNGLWSSGDIFQVIAE